MSLSVQDRRGRRFRLAFMAMHGLVAGVFCLLVTIGVVRGITSLRAPKPAAPLGVDACVEAVEELRSELLSRLAAFSRSPSAAEEADSFGPWAMKFRGRYAEKKARCAPPQGATPSQTEAISHSFTSLRRALNLSEIQATHWSRHLGPALDDAAAAIKQAQRLAE